MTHAGDSHDGPLHIAHANTVIGHLHGGLHLAAGRRSGNADLPTVYSLDVRALLATAAGVGLAIVPARDGQARAYVLLASRAVNDWVQAEVDGGRPLWLPAEPS